MAMSYWRRREQIRPRVQLFPWPVALPDRLSTAAIIPSGIWRAKARTRSTTSASVAHRDWPARFRFTVRRVWSPPCQWMISSKVSPTASTMISEMTVRMIFLRVSAVVPGLSQARTRS